LTFFASTGVVPEVPGKYPLKGATIRACSVTGQDSFSCLDPGVVTNEQGFATAEVPAGSLFGPYYFEVTGPWPDGPKKTFVRCGAKPHE
jgi:hypothetical protein